MILLRGGNVTNDVRLDRILEFDERSRDFGIRKLSPPSKRTGQIMWECNTHLDQGREGACVGFGIGHELLSVPMPATGVDARYAKEQIYWEAQKIDAKEGGSYPGADPFYEGTSVLAGVRIAKKLGWIEGYYWCFGIDELLEGIGSGPVVVGTVWTKDMHTPDRSGFIAPTGDVSGGHCYLIVGVDFDRGFLVIHNSWGDGWGIGGNCFMHIEHMGLLLEAQGEAVVFVNRRVI